MKYMFWLGILLGAGFAIFKFYMKRKNEKRREDEYFRRMEETIRRANESKKND